MQVNLYDILLVERHVAAVYVMIIGLHTATAQSDRNVVSSLPCHDSRPHIHPACTRMIHTVRVQASGGGNENYDIRPLHHGFVRQ